MKNLIKTARILVSALFILSGSSNAFSQVKQIEDPLLTHSNYISIDAGMNYVSPNYTYKNAILNGNSYNLGDNLSGAYQPIAALEVGHVFKIGPKDPFILKLNTGISIASYSLNMFNNKSDAETLSETFLQVPLAISTHIPLMVFQPQSRYHALELKFGGYYSVNIKREIQTYNVPESGSTDFTLPAYQFGKFSLFAEAGVSFTSPNGHSHEIGIRASHDMGPYLNFNNKAEELPFLYNSLGIFYRWTFYCF